MVGGSVSESAKMSRLVDSSGLHLEFLTPLGTTILSPTFPQTPRAPSTVWLMVCAFVCIYARILSAIITEYH